MAPTHLQIALLGLVQGLAELLPVSSSAHVIAAEKLMGLDPSTPSMTFLLVALHTGTMGAVVVYFWKAWKNSFFRNRETFISQAGRVVLATLATGVVYLGLKRVLEHVNRAHGGSGEIEALFANLNLIAVALAAAGLLILVSGWRMRAVRPDSGRVAASPAEALAIGLVQGVCLPFRGFSRSGATISTGSLLGLQRRAAEEFSFALAVVLTPAALAQEGHRFLKSAHAAGPGAGPSLHLGSLLAPGLLGLCCSFVAGLVALRWLSGWLTQGRWYIFGLYCLVAAGGVAFLAANGY